VLDMDETLIHFDQRRTQFRIRPFCKQFLKEIHKYWTVYIFTAALSDYADWILNDLDPDRTIFHKRLYRDSCTLKKGAYLKDLQKIITPDGKQADLRRVVIVDNLAENFQL
jgi:CTD small phosphatase-like protein 2